jgi:hypothetical protein
MMVANEKKAFGWAAPRGGGKSGVSSFEQFLCDGQTRIGHAVPPHLSEFVLPILHCLRTNASRHGAETSLRPSPL